LNISEGKGGICFIGEGANRFLIFFKDINKLPAMIKNIDDERK